MKSPERGPGAPGKGPHAHETRDVNVRLVAYAGSGLILVVILAAIAMLWLFDFFSERTDREQVPPPPIARSARQEPPQPRLQTNPRKDLADMRAEEDAVLDSYGWVDEKAGIARVPIERAVEMVAEHGVPPRTKPAETEKSR
ncbi:MAG TPA: hypothetical protein VNI57_09840 [Candidatus Saccharimonadales bacterium]|nr:hypothetical protein [Candidatus Saccharimonadales bacterium]